MNAVHPFHDPARFAELTHFVLAFHDSTFECVGRTFAVETHTSSIRAVLPRMTELLEEA